MYGYIAPIPKDDPTSLKESIRFSSDFVKSFNLLADPRNGIDVFSIRDRVSDIQAKTMSLP